MCERPAPVGSSGGSWRTRALPDAFPARAERLLEPAARAVDALLASRLPAAAVAVCGDGERALAAALVLARSGARAVGIAGDAPELAPVRVAREPERVKTLFAGAGGAERADLAIAFDGDLDAAARLVRRGGALASLGSPRRLPSVTALVQRELELVGPRDVVEALLACRLDDLLRLDTTTTT